MTSLLWQLEAIDARVVLSSINHRAILPFPHRHALQRVRRISQSPHIIIANDLDNPLRDRSSIISKAKHGSTTDFTRGYAPGHANGQVRRFHFVENKDGYVPQKITGLDDSSSPDKFALQTFAKGHRYPKRWVPESEFEVWHTKGFTPMDVNHALKGGDSYEVLSSFLGWSQAEATEGQLPSITTIPDTTFSEILRHLNPEVFIGRYLRLFQELSPRNSTYRRMLPKRLESLYTFAASFMSKIKATLSARQQQGHYLNLSDYKHILSCARAVGDVETAKSVWLIMARMDVPLDTECYNHYLATQVWADSNNSIQRHKLRVTPIHLASRTSELRHPQFGYRTGDVGLRSEVSRVFNDMVRSGIMGDEETFCLLITAQAREGDIGGIKDVLKRIWNLDVDAFMGENGTSPARPRSYVMDSPFRPTKTLLMTLAHAFGTNNQIPLALKLVDFVSRHYGIVIPRNVWEELLERTYVLSRRRTAKQFEKGQAVGQLPQEAVENLWRTLSSEPYSVRPSVKMFHFSIFSLLRRNSFADAQARMTEGLRLHKRNVIEHFSSIQLYRRALQAQTCQSRLAAIQRAIMYRHLRMHLSRQYLRRWVFHLIKRTSRVHRNTSYLTDEMPKILGKWISFLPRFVRYEMPTGHIRFNTQHNQYNAIVGARLQYHRDHSPLIWPITPESSSRKVTMAGHSKPPKHGSDRFTNYVRRSTVRRLRRTDLHSS